MNRPYNWETDEPTDEEREFSILDYVKSGGILYLAGILCYAAVEVINAIGQKIGGMR